MTPEETRFNLQSVAQRYDIIAIDECLHIQRPSKVCIQLSLIDDIVIVGRIVYIQTEKSTISLDQLYTDLRVNVCIRKR